MTKEETNWEKELKEIIGEVGIGYFLSGTASKDANFGLPSNMFYDNFTEKLKPFISKLISQERELMEKDFDDVENTLKNQINIWKIAYEKMEKN